MLRPCVRSAKNPHHSAYKKNDLAYSEVKWGHRRAGAPFVRHAVRRQPSLAGPTSGCHDYTPGSLPAPATMIKFSE